MRKVVKIVPNVAKLCMGCMSILENHEQSCPKCGYDSSKNISSPHQLKPNTILNGKYLVGKVLGEGGFGITYLGWDLNLDIKVAIKEYYPSGLVTREMTSTDNPAVAPFSGEKSEYYQSGLNKFVNEAKSLAKFYTLPSIVSVKDFFRENSTAYIVMEFVNGITLKQHLTNSNGKLRPNEVFELMRPLMKSLSQIHAEGIIHRDISPDNIMLTNKGEIKLLDFGAARDFITDGNKSLSVLLKPGYAPEEQYRTKGHQGPWTDVYALCGTIYKMITSITPPESLERFTYDELVRPSTLGIEISAMTENALLKGLAVFKKDRYQSVDKLYNDIYGATQSAQNSNISEPKSYEQENNEKLSEQVNSNLTKAHNNSKESKQIIETSINRNQNTFNSPLLGFIEKHYLLIGIIGTILSLFSSSLNYIPRHDIEVIVGIIMTIFIVSCLLQIKKWSLTKIFMLLGLISTVSFLASTLVFISPYFQIFYRLSYLNAYLIFRKISFFTMFAFPLAVIFLRIPVLIVRILAYITTAYDILYTLLNYRLLQITKPFSFQSSVFGTPDTPYNITQFLLLLLLISLVLSNRKINEIKKNQQLRETDM